MFKSATVKLTAWYLAIIMAISLLFSLFIYQINFHEVNIRLDNLQRGLIDPNLIPLLLSGGSPIIQTTAETTVMQDRLRAYQSEQASVQMALALLYVNIVILIAGGAGSYFLARRTLKPLEQAHEAQSRFTSDASHELRTPLAAMKAELEVNLRDKNLTMSDAHQLLESNLEEVNKLIDLSEMLLRLARLDYDTLPKEQFDMVDSLKAAMKPFAVHAKRFDISSRKKAVILANEIAIVELMTLLIDNAVKYSPKGSPIAIRIFERRLMTGFEIKNNGTKISPDVLARLFDRFYRGDTSRTESNKNGYGLGLAIAKRIAAIHHGSIQVRSDDKETVFTFYVPNLRNLAASIQDK
ncbi:hypothetical protein H7200_01955 [Candidatus Saccharibacteria bacterium]|nr:hypothetical protein [Candidatus Saccharibacteria bacterium]